MYMVDCLRESFHGRACPHPALTAIGWSQRRRAQSPALGAHAHAGWELCCLVSGRVEWWVENERCTLHAGDLYLTAPNERHGAIDEIFQPCQLLWCQIDATWIDAAWQVLPRCWAGAAAVEPLLRTLLHECQHPDQHSHDAAAALLQYLIIAVQRSAAGTPAAEPAPLQRIRTRIIADPAWWPSIEELASWTGLGRTRLFQLARAHWREAPLVWLARQRLRAAADRLLTNNEAITAIAHDLGYASSQHLATAFKHDFGFSPSAFRQQHMDG